jgi:hypothetical protein
MLTAVNLAPVDDLADIEAVLEQMGQRAHAKAAPAHGAAHAELAATALRPISWEAAPCPRVLDNAIEPACDQPG